MRPPDEAFDLAFAIVAQSERTAAELKSKLATKGVGEEDADRVVARMLELGYVSDVRVALNEVERALGRGRESKEKVRARLLRRGLDEALVDRSVAEMAQEGEVARALALAARLGSDASPAKTARYLVARGFDEETVRDVLARVFPDL